LIDGPIDMGWGDVGTGDEVLLPEHVVSSDSSASCKPGLGECAGLGDGIGEAFDAEDGAEGEGEFFVLFWVLVFGFEGVVDGDAEFECGVAEELGDDASGWGDEHGEDEDDSCAEDDDGAGGFAREEGGHGGADES